MVEQSLGKNPSDLELHNVCHYLLENTLNGKLRRGAVTDGAKKFGVCRRAITTIRSRASMANNPEGVKTAMERRNKGISGRKPVPAAFI